MTWRCENRFNAETVRVLEIAEHFLTEYFGHTKESAIEVVSKYFRMFDIPYVQDAVVHALSWKMAKRIHFTVALGEDPEDLIFWEMENGLRDAPAEAKEYMKVHYWDQHPNFSGNVNT